MSTDDLDADPRLQRLHAAAVADGAIDPAQADGSQDLALREWVTAPSADPRAGGVSRFLHDVYEERVDLHGAYPDLSDPSDREGFLGWAYVHGTAEGIVPQWAAPPAPAHVDPDASTSETALGVNVAGYFQSELGVGEAARRVVAALDAARVALLPVQGSTVPPSRRGHDYASVSTDAAAFPLNLVCVNADGLPRFANEAGAAFFAGRITIGMWWWELPDFPERYRSAFRHVDEVWVGSRYVQQALESVSPVPVVRVPVAVTAPVAPQRTREQLGLPEGFLVLLAFDHNSVMERKNPIGLIEAFARAFPEDSGASLVIKTINAEQHPLADSRLRQAAAARGDVHVVDGYLAAGDRDAMMAACDVYASLHRSEGFGLTLAEAMALGRPVVATGWSGNTEFMREETSWLVPCAMTSVGPGNDPYDPHSSWADPDLDAAAAALREIRNDPDGATRRAAAGAAWIGEHHSPAVAGAAMRERLLALHPTALHRAADVTGESLEPARTAVASARERITLTPAQYAAHAGNPRSAALRRIVLTATRPALRNQQGADAAVLAAIEQAVDLAERDGRRARADRLAMAHLTAGTLARQRQIERRLDELERGR